MKILVADDDQAFVELLSSRLRSKGFEVSIAFDAAQAMMFAMKNLPNAIILDIRMPGGNGLDTLKKLKTSVKTAMIPVIVVTATDDVATEKTAADLGAAWFIRKPARFEQVYNAICNTLGLSAHGLGSL
jgi:DNA-binding response OmpR family regulator